MILRTLRLSADPNEDAADNSEHSECGAPILFEFVRHRLLELLVQPRRGTFPDIGKNLIGNHCAIACWAPMVRCMRRAVVLDDGPNHPDGGDHSGDCEKNTSLTLVVLLVGSDLHCFPWFVY